MEPTGSCAARGSFTDVRKLSDFREFFWWDSFMDWQKHIKVNPAVLHGKACIRGTRIPVAVVLANLADGLSASEIIRSYPSLTAEGIQAALAYAADLAQERVLRTGRRGRSDGRGSVPKGRPSTLHPRSGLCRRSCLSAE